MRLFLVSAKKNTYATKSSPYKCKESSRKGSHDLYYQEGDYEYLDSYFGSSFFGGQEAVYQKGVCIFTMNYYGRVIDDRFSSNFLKSALSHVSITQPYRGPNIYRQGDFIYHNHVCGDMDYFVGKEEIYYKDSLLYELDYHGGVIK